MALQGTLDSFALPDVLRLLASTRKSGRLRVEGDRGTGSVWLAEGSVIGTEATGVRGDSEVDVLFQLLCYKIGSFTFDPDQAPSLPSRPLEVEPLLSEAERLLIEWRDIEKVVPSMEAWVTLIPVLPRSELYIDPHRWKTVCSIGNGTTVAALSQALETSGVMACLVVKDLVDMGLAAVTAAAPMGAPAPPPPPPPPPPPSPLAGPPPLATREPLTSAIAAAPMAPAPPPPSVPMMAAAPVEFTVTSPTTPPAADAPDPPASPDTTASPVPPMMSMEAEDDPEEVARQLATLSPKAAAAVAAASDPSYDPGSDDGLLVQVDGEEDESINRNLLIKFLSSVKH